MTKEDAIKEAVSALQMRKGDDLYRAKIAFRGLTKDQMQEQHGQSGKTRQQVLDDYQSWENRTDRAIEALLRL